MLVVTYYKYDIEHKKIDSVNLSCRNIHFTYIGVKFLRHTRLEELLSIQSINMTYILIRACENHMIWG